MTRKAVTLILAAAVVAALPWAVSGQAQEPGAPPHHERGPRFGPGFGPGPGGPGGPGLGRLAQELGLSDDQKAQIESLRAKERESSRPLMEAAREAHEAFRAVLEAESPDAGVVGQAAIAMAAADKKVRAAHEAAFEEVKALLTPEQRQKLEEAHKNGPRRGPGGPRP